jgi:quinol monooxygenase YgiN
MASKLKPLASKGGAMSKLAIVATIKTVPGKRDEYLTFLKAHGKRCLATEPGTLQFEILVPHEEADTVMLYEVYASPEAFQTHWNGTSIQQMRQDTAELQVSIKGVRGDLVE